jgi:hypothetical protein
MYRQFEIIAYLQGNSNLGTKRPRWRSGVNTRRLRKRSRVRFPHSANICVHEHDLFVLGLVVSMYNMYVFTKKKGT